MSATSRKVSRIALAGLLSTALIGVGKPTQEVLAYPPRKITKSPLVFLRSAGRARRRRGIGQTKLLNRFRLEIMIYVAAASAETEGPDPDESADALDDIEATVSDVLADNPSNAAWMLLNMLEEEMSNIYRLSAQDTGGKPYDVEIIPVEVEVYDS
jgi:hypothetical protein